MTDNKKESLSALIDGEANEIEIHKLLRHIKAIESDKTSTSASTSTSTSDSASDARRSRDLYRSWASYQEIRSVVNGSGLDRALPARSVRMAASQHLELRSRISDAIEAEDSHQLEGSSSLSSTLSGGTSATYQNSKSVLVRYRAPAAVLAIAASLVVTIFVGLSPIDEDTDLGTAGIAGQSADVHAIFSPSASQPISAQQTLSTQSAASSTGNQNNLAPASSDLNSLEQQLLSSGEDGMFVDHSELKELNEEQRQQMRAYLQLHDRMTRTNSNRRTVNFDGTKK